MMTAPPRSRGQGAPTKLPDVEGDLVALLGAGERREVAALRVGVTRATVENWLRWGDERPGSEYGQFVKRVRAAERRAIPKPGHRPRTKAGRNAGLLATFARPR